MPLNYHSRVDGRNVLHVLSYGLADGTGQAWVSKVFVSILLVAGEAHEQMPACPVHHGRLAVHADLAFLRIEVTLLICLLCIAGRDRGGLV